MKITIAMPKIPEEEKSELVVLLLEIIRQQGEIIQELKDEIARLKGHNPRPTITPSRLEQPKKEKPKSSGKKRPGPKKIRKTSELVIHAEQKVPAENVPDGSTFKGYNDFMLFFTSTTTAMSPNPSCWSNCGRWVLTYRVVSALFGREQRCFPRGKGCYSRDWP